jgi:hypothetical protein
MNVKLLITAVLFTVLALFVANVWADVDAVDTYFENVRGQLLGFYASEIVSHAAIVLGLVIALPTVGGPVLAFLRKRMRARSIETFIEYFSSFLILILIALLTLYSVGRLIYWSGMAASLMQATRTNLGVTITESNVTSCMSALGNYTIERFWNGTGLTSLLAQGFYPQTSAYDSYVLASLCLIGVTFLLAVVRFFFSPIKQWFGRMRRPQKTQDVSY